MTLFQHIRKSLTYRRAFFPVLLLVAFVVHSALAEESEPVGESTPAEETAEATEVMSTEVTPTPFVLESTIMPTEIAPTAVMTAPTETIPTQTTPIVISTAPPITLIGIAANAARLPANTVLSVILTAENLSNLNHFALTCQVDPAILRGILAVPGDLLPADQVEVSDSGFQANGQWQFTAVHMNSTIPDAGVLWSMNYEVIGAGFTSLLCWIQDIDANGQPLPLTIPAAGLTIEGYQAEIFAPPTVVVTEIVSTPVVIEPIIAVTEIISTPIPIEATIEATPEIPLPLTSHLSGYVGSLFLLKETVITVSGSPMEAKTAADSDGAFAFDLLPGDYQLTVTAPYHLPFALNIVVSEQPLALPTIMLTGGDIDGNATINAADTDLIIQNYGLAAPPAPPAADLNGDGMVNLYDLTLLSAKIR